jgi:hypothetical protein
LPAISTSPVLVAKEFVLGVEGLWPSPAQGGTTNGSVREGEKPRTSLAQGVAINGLVLEVWTAPVQTRGKELQESWQQILPRYGPRYDHLLPLILLTGFTSRFHSNPTISNNIISLWPDTP